MSDSAATLIIVNGYAFMRDGEQIEFGNNDWACVHGSSQYW